MKNKPLIIILIATVLALGSYLVYRNLRRDKEVTQQQENASTRMVTLAKQSPKAGLAEMARAIKRYHADQKSYPPDLNALFPKYIKSEALIDDINWSYKPSGSGFLLSKSIAKNDQRIVVSIDDSLRFKTDQKIMLASRAPESASEQKPDAVESRRKENQASMISKVNEMEDTAQTLLSSNTQVQPAEETMDMIDVEKQPEMVAESEEAEEIIEPPKQKEPVLIARAVESRMELIADAGTRYFVWIGKDGYLGFSNVQYPDSQKIGYYYFGGKWEPVIR